MKHKAQKMKFQGHFPIEIDLYTNTDSHTKHTTTKNKRQTYHYQKSNLTV